MTDYCITIPLYINFITRVKMFLSIDQSSTAKNILRLNFSCTLTDISYKVTDVSII